MKKIIGVLGLIFGISAQSAHAGEGFTYRCYSRSLGSFGIAFDAKGKAFSNFDYLVNGNKEVYEIKKDEDFENEQGIELYTARSRDGTAEFLLDPVLALGGAKLKSNKTGGYVSIKTTFRVGLRLPQSHDALCVRTK